MAKNCCWQVWNGAGVLLVLSALFVMILTDLLEILEFEVVLSASVTYFLLICMSH